MSDNKARHFHAGKLRKEIDGVEYVEVAESNGKVFVSKTGTFITPRHKNGGYRGVENGNGYMMIGSPRGTPLPKDYAHVVVYEVFKGEVRCEIDHLNRDRADNRVENLRDITHAENNRTPATMSAREAAIGRRVRNKETKETFLSEAAAGRAYGLSRKTIHAALTRQVRAGGFHWEYVA